MLNNKIGYEIRDGVFYSNGIDYGGTVHLITESKKYILIHRKGRVAWSGVGQTKYYPPKYFILKKVGKGKYWEALGSENSFEYSRNTSKAVRGAVMKKWGELNAL